MKPQELILRDINNGLHKIENFKNKSIPISGIIFYQYRDGSGYFQLRIKYKIEDVIDFWHIKDWFIRVASLYGLNIEYYEIELYEEI